MNIRNNDNFDLLKNELALSGYNERYIDIDIDGDMTIYAIHVPESTKINLSCYLDQVMSSEEITALTADEVDAVKNQTVIDIFEYLENLPERD